MDKMLASELMDFCQRHSSEWDDMLTKLRSGCSASELETYTKLIANHLGGPLFEIMSAIGVEHPDLAPSWLKD